MSSSTSTVILGSGIVGLCTAYYLSESGNTDPQSIHLIDSSPELFQCASGLAGGYLAKDCKCSKKSWSSLYTLVPACVTSANAGIQGSLHQFIPSAHCPSNFTQTSHARMAAGKHGATRNLRACRFHRTVKANRQSVAVEKTG